MKTTGLSLIILSISLITLSCETEPNQTVDSQPEKFGCMDPDSENYDPDANQNDNSCEYAGSISFFIDEEAEYYLVDNGVTELFYYVNDSLIGSLLPTENHNEHANCGEPNTILFSKDLDGLKSCPIDYQIKDQNGNFIRSGTINVLANTCSISRLFL